MGANRKVQAEIDRTMKKVDEGVALFDEIYEKVMSATQPNQKEKYESDLKKEIKKLQRSRDTIKSWIASSEIKDKVALMDARKRIEAKMEQFKVCEKETKTKAFSKEGLAKAVEKDPDEVERESSRAWLQEGLDKLQEQLDGFEADVERLTGGKKKKSDVARVEVLENGIAQHRFHIGKLEQIMRLLDNEDLSPSEVNAIQENIEYYVSQGNDVESIDKFGEDTYDHFYEDLSLDEFPVGGPGVLLGKGRRLPTMNEEDEEGDGDDESSKEAAPTPAAKENKGGKAAKRGAKAAAAAAAAAAATVAAPAASAAPAAMGRGAQQKVGKETSPANKATAAATAAVAAATAAAASAGPTAAAQGKQRVVVPGGPGAPLPVVGRPAGAALTAAKGKGAAAADAHHAGPAAGTAAASAALPPPAQPPGGPAAAASPGPTAAVRVAAMGPPQSPQMGRPPTPGQTAQVATARPGQPAAGQPPLQVSTPHGTPTKHATAAAAAAVGPRPGMPPLTPQQPGAAAHAEQHGAAAGMGAAPQGMHMPSPAARQTSGDHHHQQQQQQLQMQHMQQQQALQGQVPVHTPSSTALQPQQVQQQLLQQRPSQQQLPPPLQAPQGQQQQQQRSPAPHQQGSPYLGAAPPPLLVDGRSGDGLGGFGAAHYGSAGDGAGEDGGSSAGGGGGAAAGGLGSGLTAGSGARGGGGVAGLDFAAALAQAASLRLLQQSMHFVPQQNDSERTKQYTPRNPHRTHAAFPQQPSPVFESPAAFEKFSTDTLFFIFYYQQGTYQQYLAARELKRQSWRYHKKYMTWFQRHEEPKVTTDDFEQGTYVYFDYETGWCQRIKADFTFEYSFLEDEIL